MLESENGNEKKKTYEIQSKPDVLSVAVIAEGNGIGDLISNPRQSYLCYLFAQLLLRKAWIHLFYYPAMRKQ